MGDDEDVTGYRIKSLEARVAVLEGYVRNAVKGLLGAVVFIMWEPIRQLLALVGLVK